MNIKDKINKILNEKIDGDTEFVVIADTNRAKKDIISMSMPKKDAEKFKKRLEDEMKTAILKYKWAKNIKVVPTDTVDESKKEKFKLRGREYDSIVFDSDKEANDFMKKNKAYGVIGTKGNKVYVAKMDESLTEASLTRQHFVALANIMKVSKDMDTLKKGIVDWLTSMNPRFARERFYKAAGITESTILKEKAPKMRDDAGPGEEKQTIKVRVVGKQKDITALFSKIENLVNGMRMKFRDYDVS